MAALPDIIPIASIEFGGVGVYKLLKPFDSTEQSIYLVPQNHIISVTSARGDGGYAPSSYHTQYYLKFRKQRTANVQIAKLYYSPLTFTGIAIDIRGAI